MKRYRVGKGGGKVKSAMYSQFCTHKWSYYSTIKLCQLAKQNILGCSNNFMHYNHTITSNVMYYIIVTNLFIAH
jgi:hypothetical protein